MPLTEPVASQGYRVWPSLPIQSMSLISLLAAPANHPPSTLQDLRWEKSVYSLYSRPLHDSTCSPKQQWNASDGEANVMLCPGHCVCHKPLGIREWPLHKVTLAKMSLYCSLPGDELSGARWPFSSESWAGKSRNLEQGRVQSRACLCLWRPSTA